MLFSRWPKPVKRSTLAGAVAQKKASYLFFWHRAPLPMSHLGFWLLLRPDSNQKFGWLIFLQPRHALVCLVQTVENKLKLSTSLT